MKSKNSPVTKVAIAAIRCTPSVSNCKCAFLLIVLLSLLAGAAMAQVKTTVAISTTWKFKTDPTNIGATTGGWYSATFNDSSWGTLLSGRSWESQGQAYAGYAWYRQSVNVPAVSVNVPVQALQLNLPSIISDDDVWFNGVHVGGITGGYKYNNFLTRNYLIPASLVNFGGANIIAIRIWGGSMGLSYNNSGLIAGTINGILDPFRVMARNTGGSIASEVPIELYDLSGAQQGNTFEIVFNYPQTILTGTGANLTYTLRDFYGASILGAKTVPTTTGTDGIVRGVASISGTVAQALYVAGRFSTVLVLKDAATGTTLSSGTTSTDHLSFAARDTTQLPVLSSTFTSTPYGSLKLVDTIDCSTPLATEIHPYMQSAFGQHLQDYCTPGSKATVAVSTILGKSAREATWGWYAYRIGRGTITPGKTYLLRVEYCEDTPRMGQLEIQSGHNYMDVGWKNGITANSCSSYGDWPLTNAWQYYDVMVTAGDETTGTGGTGDDTGQNGFWVYVMNKIKSGSYFSMYAKGPAIATMSLYEIDSAANAPAFTLPPAGIPQRVMTFDWERQVEQAPADMVNYAKLMGYSAISPNMLKWALANYSDVTNGYDTMNIDDAGYWVQNLSTNPAAAPIPGLPSVHKQYLDATASAGLDYIPRIEYGGSTLLSGTAYAISNTGTTTPPTRFTPAWCANLVNPAVYTDFKTWLDMNIGAYQSAYPQMKGVLWRIREQRMPVSYGKSDIDLFCSDTGATEPAGYTTVQLAHWASNTAPEGAPTVAANYSTWWQAKRRDFHQQIESLLKSYRPNMVLYYFNWDPDKFSLLAPDINSADFFAGGSTTAHYLTDGTNRATWTDTQYTNVLTSGDLSASGGAFLNRPDFALRPSLYTSGSSAGIQLLAPINYLFYANKTNYVNYFQTFDGMAASNCISYDEIASREPNPKYEGTMLVPGGAPFSMAMELLSYYYGDARTLTYTAYTYGRGFADAHRRFAQAFRALPAVPGTLVAGSPANTAVRTYATANGTYVGVAYKGYTGSTFTVTVPGAAGGTVTNLVTGSGVSASNSGADLTFSLTSGPMELNAFLVNTAALPSPWLSKDIGTVVVSGTATYAGGTFTIIGSGTSTTEVDAHATDAFQYVYQAVSGTAQTLTARVATQQNTAATARAGVMIRQDLTNGAANACEVLNPTAGGRFKYRLTPGGTLGNIAGGGMPPYWVRVVRNGSTFTGYTSPDGSVWTQRGTTTITMSGTTYIGLVQCSGTNTPGTSTFDNVTLTSP